VVIIPYGITPYQPLVLGCTPHRVVGNYTLRRRGLRFIAASSSATALFVVADCALSPPGFYARRLQRFVAPPLSTKSCDFAEAFVASGLRLTPFRGLLLIPKSLTAFREPFHFVVPAFPEGDARIGSSSPSGEDVVRPRTGDR